MLVQKLNFRACNLKLYLETLIDGVRAAAMEMSRRLEDPRYILGFWKPDEASIKYAVSSWGVKPLHLNAFLQCLSCPRAKEICKRAEWWGGVGN